MGSVRAGHVNSNVKLDVARLPPADGASTNGALSGKPACSCIDIANRRKDHVLATYPEIMEDPYPYQDLIGFKIVDWTPEKAVLHLPIRVELGNRYGIPHGGIHAAILDTVMGFSGCFTGKPDEKRLAMTLSLNISYLSRPKGETLIAEGWKIGGGRKTFFADSTVSDETGELIARGSGTFRYRSVPA